MIIPIDQIEVNEGQIEGLPANPRLLRDTKIQKLVKSITEDPEMLKLRGLLVYPYKGRYVAIGGNARLLALRRLDYTDVDCVVIPKETSVAKLKNYILKDNASFGDWDFKALAEWWTIPELDGVAIDLPKDFAIAIDDDIFSEDKKGNNVFGAKEKEEHRSNLEEDIRFHTKGEMAYLTTFRTSKKGDTLTEIKANKRNADIFAQSAVKAIRMLIGLRKQDGWCIITTPKRRHKTENFAEITSRRIAEILGIPFYEDVVTTKNRDRLHPDFSLEYSFAEENVIVYDDIVTTGKTIMTMYDLLYLKNTVFINGIRNDT